MDYFTTRPTRKCQNEQDKLAAVEVFIWKFLLSIFVLKMNASKCFRVERNFLLRDHARNRNLFSSLYGNFGNDDSKILFA